MIKDEERKKVLLSQCQWKLELTYKYWSSMKIQALLKLDVLSNFNKNHLTTAPILELLTMH